MPAASTLEPRAKRAWAVIAAWIAGISAVLGFIGATTGFFGNIRDHFHHNAALDLQFATAQSQSRQGDYQAAVQTYADILKADPVSRPALDQQLQTTMLWVEHFHTYVKEGEDPAGMAGPQLDQIILILDAGLPRTKGTANADVEAHLGWAHWLNQHIAAREFGNTAEHDFRAALTTDPNNVYAHAMLGNWMMQNGGSFAEAVDHLHAAVATGKARPFVRALQIGGLGSSGQDGARAELVRTVNDMRKGNEPLSAEGKSRILGWCFTPELEPAELNAALTAAPSDEIWQTYLWLDAQPDEEDAFQRDFIQASLTEISGNRAAALAQFRAVQQKLKAHPGSLQQKVNAAVARLSHP